MATGHDHDPHDGPAAHVAENPRWVLVPLLVGLVLGVILLVILGIDGGVPAFTD
jgi:hypothetical protein